MNLPVRLPILPSQCYSASGDVELDGRHGTAGAREPLRESTGNAQHNHHIQTLVRSSSYDQRAAEQSVYPIPPSISAPSLYLAQALDFIQPQYARSFLQQGQAQQHAQVGRRGLRRNPFWVSPEFQAYRKRQNERDDKAGQKWPDILEEAFLDAFLLMPQIGKSKYSIRGKPYGRNMLIGEYMWLYFLASLPPGAIPDEAYKRERKQVSSHIQVLKNFLKLHPWFHIFFPNYETGSRGRKDKNRENQAKESFKNHPVLIALTEQRLPDEVPNDEYFTRILSMKNAIAIKPKRCWVFVSHRDVTVQEDGSGLVNTTGDRLPSGEYPHLKLNLERGKWAKEEQQQIFKGSLLHEFTKDLTQCEASTVREISEEWEETCPELHAKLEDSVKDMSPLSPSCDIIHMHSMLELKAGRQFPSHSDLNSWVEIVIEQPHLLNHRWKVETTLVRPPELSYLGEKSAPETVYRTSAKMGIQYQNRPGCEGHRGSGGGTCDSRCRRDCVIVPFPADVFAVTLTNCAEYPAHPPIDVLRRGSKRSPVVKTEDGDQDQDSKTNSGDQPTQMDLVPRMAMMQELWSCPPDEGSNLYGDDAHGRGNKKSGRWERRGIVLWTFRTVHSIEYPSDKPPELKTAPNGKTQWRFLQILDTSSPAHLQQVLVKGDGTCRHGDGPANRASGFHSSGKLGSRAPSPMANASHQQPRSASTNDSFSAASWDVHGGSLNSLSSSATQVRNAHAHAQADYNTQLMLQTQAGGMLDNFGGAAGSGLATPPPSASLASSFATSFENFGNDGAYQLTNYMAAHGNGASDMTAVHSQQTLSDLLAVTDPLLASSAGSSFDTGVFDETAAHDDVSGWATSGGTVPGANSWSTGYSTVGATTANGNQHHPTGAAVMHWAHGSPSAGAAGSNETLRHYSQHEHTTTQPPQLHLQTQGHYPQHPHHWVTGNTADSEETGFWTPATSTDDALTSGIDTRDQIIWPVSGPRITNSVHDHNQAQIHHNRVNGDDWVHVDHSSSGAVTSTDAEMVEGEADNDYEALSAASELSQGWEEIVAAAAAAAASESQQQQDSQSKAQPQYNYSQSTVATDHTHDDSDGDFAASFPLGPLAAAGHLQHMSNSFLEPRGQKRSRSNIRDEFDPEAERMERRHAQRIRREDETC